jgi:hypothetical protein
VLPLFMNGLGAFEYVVEYLYQNLPGTPASEGQGLLVSLTYRAITILIALVGVCYYFARRREVASVWHEAEEEAQHESETPLAEEPLDTTANSRAVSGEQ